MSNRIANIELALTVLAATAGNIGKSIDGAVGGVHEKLAVAMAAQADLRAASEAIELSLQAAADGAANRVSMLRAEIREAAVVEVLAGLRDGSLSLVELAARAGVSVEGMLTLNPFHTGPSATISVEAPAAPSKPAGPAVGVNGEPLSQAVRENLRLQAGYMHAVKYRDPNTGAGWSGRGPQPKWLKALCVDGATPADFLVATASSQVAASVSAAQAQVLGEATVAPASDGPEALLSKAADPEASAPEADAPATVSLESVESVESVEPVEPVASVVEELGASAPGAGQPVADDVCSFDATLLAGDLNTAATGDTSLDSDDIGEMLSDLASMSLPAGNTAMFRAAA